jgi:hypothetical protein
MALPSVNPERRGTKIAFWHRVTVGAGETVEIRLRLARDTPGRTMDLGDAFIQTQADRSREADEYYAALRPEGTSDEEAMVMRQAFAGMSWSLQFYNYGGNSNWRGPVWFPLNFLAIESLRHLHNFFGDDLTVELPTGSGKKANLRDVAAELERRLLSLFLLDANDRRPAHGANPRFQNDPAWRDSLLFYEYFHGETGEGLGAWTALAGALVASGSVRRPAQPKT